MSVTMNKLFSYCHFCHTQLCIYTNLACVFDASSCGSLLPVIAVLRGCDYEFPGPCQIAGLGICWCI